MSMPCQSDWKLSKLFQDRNKKLGSFLVSKYFETRFFSWRRCGFQFVSLTSAFIPLKATFLHTANHSHSSPADCEKKPRFHLLRSSSAIFTQVAGNPVLNIRAREKKEDQMVPEDKNWNGFLQTTIWQKQVWNWKKSLSLIEEN